MRLAIAMGCLLTALCFPGDTILGLTIVATLVCAVLARHRWSFRIHMLVAGLLVFPVLLLVHDRGGQSQPLPEPDMTPFRHMADTDFLSHSQRDRCLGILESAEPRLTNPKAAGLLSGVSLEPYESLTLINLNMEPIAWQGHYFSDDYRDLDVGRGELVLKDGRLFYVNLIPLPSAQQATGYLVVDILFLTARASERGDSWLASTYPAYLPYRPTVVQSDYSSYLEDRAAQLGLAPLPFDIHFVPEPDHAPLLDYMAAVWVLLFIAALFVLRRRLQDRSSWPWFCLYLTLLAWPHTTNLDFLTCFGSYIFGTLVWGNLLADPVHFLLTIVTAFHLVQSLSRLVLSKWPPWPFLLFGLVFGAGLAAPAFFQRFATFSFIHPLEAFNSPGSLLAYVAFLAIFVFLVLLLDGLRPTRRRAKLLLIIPVLILLSIWLPQYLIGGISLCLIWLFRKARAGAIVRGALAVLAFYPLLVLQQQTREVAYIRNDLLDEITLLGERNHFRIGRIVQGLPKLQWELQYAPHHHLMELFARESGLFQDEIDFSLRLTGPGGTVVSEISQHLTLDQMPVLVGAENRITDYLNPPDGPNWILFRKTLRTANGNYDFLAALGNDYQNLSLVRATRVINEATSTTGGSALMPYLGYNVDVFDTEGNSLYNQSTPAQPLRFQDRLRLGREPYFWYVTGRDTVFFFNYSDTIFRIAHKATPLKMISVRYLFLFLTVVLMINMVKLAQRPGRGPLATWRRSFAIKLAGFMFLSSVLPTTMLGYFLIDSIHKNQSRSNRELALSKIQAAKNLFNEVGRAQQGLGEPRPADGFGSVPDRSRPRDLPIQKYANILGEDLSLFISGSMVKTSQPELFRLGVLNRRLDYDLAAELHLDKMGYVYRAGTNGPGIAYTPISLGANRTAVLAMTMIPFNQKQERRWSEQLEFSVTLLAGVLFLMAVLARFFAKSYLRPVAAITRGAGRMAKGLHNRPISIHRQDELERMVQAFNTMQERIRRHQLDLSQQLGLLEETLKSMSSGLLGFDHNGKVILANAMAEELLGLNELPDSLDTLVALQPRLNMLAELFEMGRNGDVDYREGNDGGVREISAKLILVDSEKAVDLRGILAIEDTTDAVAASRFKAWSEMASRVAHEIKNPLTPIRLEIDHLNRLYKDDHPDFGTALDEASREILDQVRHLQRIATEFGDYARPATLEPEQVDLSTLVESILAPYEKTLAEMTFVKELPAGFACRADARLLRRALHNIIVNALQAMDSVGELRVRLFAEKGMAHLWVEDTGPGIPVEERDKVFDAYFSTKDQGTGLGLVIARKYINLHGGTLAVDDHYVSGTRFIIRLPLEPEPDAPEPRLAEGES